MRVENHDAMRRAIERTAEGILQEARSMVPMRTARGWYAPTSIRYELPSGPRSRSSCVHDLEPVNLLLTGELVAYLCLRCDAALPPSYPHTHGSPRIPFMLDPTLVPAPTDTDWLEMEWIR